MPRRSQTSRRQLRLGLAFASPWLIGFVALVLGPIAASGYYSFTDFNLFQSPTFVGVDNYTTMLDDDRFATALFNTLYLTVVGVPLALLLSLGFALALNSRVRGLPLYRAIVYLPTIIPIVVSVYVWRWLLNAQYGYLNRVLGFLHLPQPSWLEDPAFTKPAVVLLGLWMVGGTTVIFLAALKDVPRETFEAALVDGAGPWQRFRAVTWPAISPVTLFQLIVGLITSLQLFTQPYLFAQKRLNEVSGGPDDSLLTYGMYVYQNAFAYLKMGYASALAWVLFLITVAITAVLMLTSRKWVHYGQ
ncbi:sugar ABC transporter permease [Dactylosporangium sp. AC04546]|uniref:carbohydrate ABC transporter permease n=1 Tax=Dactylosporangium sp. AC04546 TaxID=2862460 RepID=UPI001EE0FAC0|nr:sugar ABC transporter permease [Dactylosporangium sp. AC04546]WVK79926.1 sugar ABC transporter permease [Dactylosporangium sp. AC04546]